MMVREEIEARMQHDPRAYPDSVPAAARELERRLMRTGLTLPPRTRSRADKRPRTRAVPVLKRDASPVELLIIRAISRTSGAAQFGCSPRGTVFTADTDGYSLHSGRRNEVTLLSPLLVEVADIFNEWHRKGVGGRFYERDGSFFDADDGAVLVELELRVESVKEEQSEFDRARRNSPVGDKPSSGAQGLLHRLFGWIGR
jgi:hypothetical protein